MKTRRSFLSAAGLAAGGSLLALTEQRPPSKEAAAAPAAGSPPLKPRALKAGDTVGLIAPSTCGGWTRSRRGGRRPSA